MLLVDVGENMYEAAVGVRRRRPGSGRACVLFAFSIVCGMNPLKTPSKFRQAPVREEIQRSARSKDG